MNLLSVNLESKLIAANRKVLAADRAALTHQSNLDAQIEKLRLNAESTVQAEHLDVAKELGFSYKFREAAKVKKNADRLAHLPAERVFDENAIQKLCVTYGLRFLDTSYYKGALDAGITPALEAFKALHLKRPKDDYDYYLNNTSYKIVAPTSSFVLSARPKDPLLFACLGEGKYYLIHKWGDDLSVGARIKNWCWNLWIPVIGISALVGIVCAMYGWLPAAITGLLSTLAVAMLAAHAGDSNEGLIFQTRVTNNNWNSPFSN